MLTLQNIAYSHPDRTALFHNVNLIVNKDEKVALIGKNGSGKSTLLKLASADILPNSGTIQTDSESYYIPQLFGQFDDLLVADALKVNRKIAALREILEGNVSEANYETLNDDWNIEERCRIALDFWNLEHVGLEKPMNELSGGQQAKVFLAGILVNEPKLILLDEPTNHLDRQSREKLYDWVKNTQATILLVSHDRELLELATRTAELSAQGIANYGGNYSHYLEAKQLESQALEHDINDKQRELRKAKTKERETNERQQKREARGKGKQEKSGVARIMMNTLRNKAENSSAKLKDVHHEKILGLSQELRDLRQNASDIDKMSFGFDDSSLHQGKLLFEGQNVNVRFSDENLWKTGLDFEIRSGERISLEGQNGSGKTTFIKILTEKTAASGELSLLAKNCVYVDQDYSLLDDSLSVYDQAQKANTSNLPEHEVRMRLDRFLFPMDKTDKNCRTLSGGERMRLVLCCLTMSGEPIDVLILDEPTNNLDLYNIAILTEAINQYKGTLIVVSHDKTFLEEIQVNRSIRLER